MWSVIGSNRWTTASGDAAARGHHGDPVLANLAAGIHGREELAQAVARQAGIQVGSALNAFDPADDGYDVVVLEAADPVAADARRLSCRGDDRNRSGPMICPMLRAVASDAAFVASTPTTMSALVTEPASRLGDAPLGQLDPVPSAVRHRAP